MIYVTTGKPGAPVCVQTTFSEPVDAYAWAKNMFPGQHFELSELPVIGDGIKMTLQAELEALHLSNTKMCKHHMTQPAEPGRTLCRGCYELLDLVRTCPDLIAKLVTESGDDLVWFLPKSKFVGVSPVLHRGHAEWQASYLARYFGDEALTGLAAYFGVLGKELTERARLRDLTTLHEANARLAPGQAPKTSPRVVTLDHFTLTD